MIGLAFATAILLLTGAALLTLGVWIGTRGSSLISQLGLRMSSEASSMIQKTDSSLQQTSVALREAKETRVLLERSLEQTKRSHDLTMAMLDKSDEKVEKLDSNVGALISLMQRAGMLVPKPTEQVGSSPTRPSPTRDSAPVVARRSVPERLGQPT